MTQAVSDAAAPSTNGNGNSIIELENIRKYFPITRGVLLRRLVGEVKAVDGVSFQIKEGETYSLVGESGCGKTTTARMVLQVETPSEGVMKFNGKDASRFTGPERREYRASVQAVFQDPWSSLNPRMRVGSIILEPLLTNQPMGKHEAQEHLQTLLRDVGLRQAQGEYYPHEFSGGQRQRIAIARALSLRPKLIVLDEPVSALDVSIRAQIMNLLRQLQDQYGVSFLLIAHTSPREVYEPPGGRDVSGPHGGTGSGAGVVLQSQPPVHEGADRRVVAFASRHRTGRDGDFG